MKDYITMLLDLEDVVLKNMEKDAQEMARKSTKCNTIVERFEGS